MVAGLGASGDPVSADQGPVQADERLAVPAEPVQDVGDLGGSLGDYLQGLVQVALTWLIVGWLGCLGAGCCWDCGGCVGWGAH